MAQTVSSHQLGAISTPATNASIVSSVVRGNFQSTRTAYNAHDADPGVHFQSSVAASKPAAGTAGRKWLETDTLKVFFDTGSVWSEIAYAPTASPTFTGTAAFANLTTSGTIVATGTITGTLATAAQPNITSVGTLTSLTTSGAIVATGTITGTLATAAQPNVTSVGTLTSLTVSGAVSLTASAGTVAIGATSLAFQASGSDLLTLTPGSGNFIAAFGDVSDGTMVADVVCQPPVAASSTKGFLRVGVLGEAPTGAASDGCVVLDEVNHRLYVRSNGAWKYAALT